MFLLVVTCGKKSNFSDGFKLELKQLAIYDLL